MCTFCYYYVLCWLKNEQSDVHFRRIKSVLFLWKDGKHLAYEDRTGRKSVSCCQSWGSCVVNIVIKVLLSTSYLDLPCKHFCFLPKKRYAWENNCSHINIEYNGLYWHLLFDFLTMFPSLVWTKLNQLSREIKEEHCRNSQSWIIAFLYLKEDHVTQLLKEMESRLTEEQFTDFSRTQGWILGALAQWNNFFLNPAQSETVRKTWQISITENQEPNEDHSENIPRSEKGTSIYRLSQFMSSNWNDGTCMLTGPLENFPNCHNAVS